MAIEDKYLEERTKYIFQIPDLIESQPNVKCCYNCRFSDFAGKTVGVCFHPVIMNMVEGEHDVNPLSLCPKFRR